MEKAARDQSPAGFNHLPCSLIANALIVHIGWGDLCNPAFMANRFERSGAF
jgi:hypothetical protein